LREQYKVLNPAELKRVITRLQNKLIDMVMLKNERSESYVEIESVT